MREFDLTAHAEYDDHRRVWFVNDPQSGLKAIIAIHSYGIRAGGSGGTRMWPYENPALALRDVLRLSRAMSYKFALANVPAGGAKSVIIGDPGADKSEELLQAFGRCVEELGGLYYCAPDVGTTSEDMAIINRETRYVRGLPGKSGDTAPATAWGVYQGLLAAVGHRYGSPDMAGKTIAVQGLGGVGYGLCRYLHKDGAKLVVTDIDEAAINRAQAEFGADAVAPDAILSTKADILAPCALGGVLTSESVPSLDVDIVCGGANNQLQDDNVAEEIAERGILYIPDFVANAGGVYNAATEANRGAYDRDAVFEAIERIRSVTAEILERATSEECSPQRAAMRMAEEIIETRSRNAKSTHAANAT